ncbi:HORMA domain-containing protein [Suillus subluteus]|nr:HORMA domain-containing protein [Suillus subluteus]
MQMQRTVANTETQTISNKQSLECVQTLLKAGLGCIAYLRGLLPAENFGEYGTTGLKISGVTIMTLNRGFTNEGDRIIDYLENGIFEAIDKQYLRKVIFGIYLDSKDPNKFVNFSLRLLLGSLTGYSHSIVEAYTFNFHYHKLPGSRTAIPIMTLGDQLSKMSLARPDPVSEALKKGQIPTLGEVKRSVKAMIKSLITTINQMENLPKNRYGNFKLFFNEDAPDDYQPPHFQAADAEANRWFFTTHATGEVPERTSIGQVNAGWHGLDMKVVSVSSYLPSISEDNNAPFAGITSHTAPRLTPVEEARIRVEDAQLQKKDALERNIVWSVDEDEDAEGEMVIDEGIVLSRFGGDVVMAPVGIRSEDGGVQTFPQVNVTSSRALAQYDGMPESTPIRVGDLNITKAARDIEETQQIPPTQEIVMGSPIPAPSSNKALSLPASDDLLGMGNGVPTAPDSEMLDMETQVLEVPGPSCNSGITGPQIPRRNKRSKGSGRLTDEGQLDCDCGISVRTQRIEKKHKSIHPFGRLTMLLYCVRAVATVGSTSDITVQRDKRLPSQFMCFDCRLRGSHEWTLSRGRFMLSMIARYKDLALFSFLTRLEEEGIGVTAHHAKNGQEGAKTKKQKELQKTKYVFLSKAKRSKGYADYFNPLTEVENRLMGLSDTIPTYVLRLRRGQVLLMTNHKPKKTQNVLTLAVAHQAEKRKAATDLVHRGKRVKISIGSGVDLCD